MGDLRDSSALRKAVKNAAAGTGMVRKAIESAGFFITGRGYTGLIRDCRNSRQWEKALEILDIVREGNESLGGPLSFYTFSATISVCSKSGRLGETMRLLREMQAAAKSDTALQPDAAVYRLIILCSARLGKCQVAVDLLHEMFQQGLEADVETLKRVLLALVQCGEWKEAVWLLNLIHEGGEVLSSERYNDFIGCAADAGETGVAVEVFLMMQMAGVIPNSSSCHCMVYAVQASGDLDTGLHLLRDMHEGGILVYTKTYACLMRASIDAGRQDVLQKVTTLMEKSQVVR